MQEGIFNPPQDVKFADFSEMMRGFGTSAAPIASPVSGEEEVTKMDPCAVCANLPAESQAQCEESLNCP